MDKQKELNCEFYDNNKCSINDKNNLCDCQNNRLICSKIVAKTLTEEVRKQKEIEEMAREKVYDILNKFEFFQGQRAGRELWCDKTKAVQDQDISDFVEGINYIRAYLQDSVVLSREEYEKLKEEIKRLDQARLDLQVDNNMLYLQLDNKGKETAERFAKALKNSGEIMALLEMSIMPKLFKTIYDKIVERTDEIVKQF